MNALRLERRGAHPRRLSGPLIEAALRGVSIGEVCEVRRHWASTELLARAQVIGFKPDVVVLSLLGEARGLSRESMIVPTGSTLRLYCSAAMLGSVLDARGTIVERLAPAAGFAGRDYPVDADPPSYQQRRPVNEPLMTGIRAIDGLLTCGIGQRLGIFAAAGSGKTSLINMLISHTEADVFVIGLIGERGREVTEFIEHLRHSHKRARCVVVYATSDLSSVDRSNAALQATAVAEYFCGAAARLADALCPCSSRPGPGSGRDAGATGLSGLGIRRLAASARAPGAHGAGQHHGVLHRVAGKR